MKSQLENTLQELEDYLKSWVRIPFRKSLLTSKIEYLTSIVSEKQIKPKFDPFIC